MLIVEDVPDDAELTLLELSRSGFNPISEVVENAAQMRSALAKGPWDIVLSDYSMPDFGAEAAFALCREIDPEVPFILISGTIGEERSVEIMRLGFGDYLLKGKLAGLLPVVEAGTDGGLLRDRHRADCQFYLCTNNCNASLTIESKEFITD